MRRYLRILRWHIWLGLHPSAQLRVAEPIRERLP